MNGPPEPVVAYRSVFLSLLLSGASYTSKFSTLGDVSEDTGLLV